MKQFVNRIVTKRMQRLRVCLLITLAATLGCMLLTPPKGGHLPVESMGEMPLAGVTVALDPGHGGYDGGARARDSGTWEKELTLAVALEAERALTARGARVVLTRREDICLAEGDTATRARKRQDLRRRMEIADEAGADLFLSIHMNEYRSRSQSGPQVFYRKANDAGRLLAGAMQQALIARLKPEKHREALAGDYYVLGGELPSVLVECGFLSNSREEALLLTEDYRAQVGEAIADGVQEYIALRERVEKARPGPPACRGGQEAGRRKSSLTRSFPPGKGTVSLEAPAGLAGRLTAFSF